MKLKNLAGLIEKRFYNRETYRTAFKVIQQMSINPTFPSMQMK